MQFALSELLFVGISVVCNTCWCTCIICLNIFYSFFQKYMPLRKTGGEEMNFTYVECLLYAFHHLAHKVVNSHYFCFYYMLLFGCYVAMLIWYFFLIQAPNATNSLCGYKIVTGQPSDRLGEDFSECYKDFTERLTTVEDLTRATMKKLTQGMAEHNKAMAAAKSDEAKDNVVSFFLQYSLFTCGVFF